MKQFHVTGMSCAACSARVEKAVNALEGVSSCSVSLLESLSVIGSFFSFILPCCFFGIMYYEPNSKCKFNTFS